MCGTIIETVNHIVCECSKLAQKEYKRRRDWVGKKIHWDLWKKFEIDVAPKWYQHEPEAVKENEKCKILWDVSIQTDRVIEARRPDMVVVDKGNKCCEIIDFAIPYDSKTELKEQEKIEKYQDLRGQLKKMRNCARKTSTDPLFIEICRELWRLCYIMLIIIRGVKNICFFKRNPCICLKQL